jgi:hypothetical protein
MSGPPIPYSNPAPVILATPSNLGVETSLQYSNDHYYFALSIDPSGATNFNGPIVVEGTGAAVNILDSNNNAAVIAYPIGIGAGRITLSSAGSTGVVGSSYATLDGAQGNVTGNFNIAMNGSISPGNILNYNPTGSLTQLGNANGIVQVVGSSGVGQVYDEVNHPVISNTNVVTIGTYTGTFGTITDVGYTPATSGYYLVTSTLTVNGVGIAWGSPNGSANLNTGLTLTQASINFIPGTVVSFYGLQQGLLYDTKQVLVYLTGGVPVYNDVQGVGTPNAGSTGGLVVTIQPFA